MKKKLLLLIILFLAIGIVKAEECSYENRVGVLMDCNLHTKLLEYYPNNFLEYMPQSEYDSIKNNNPEDIETISLQEILEEDILLRSSYYSTTYKEIRLIKNGNFITASLVWLKNPQVRSYDVFAVRLTSGVSINGDIAFRQISHNAGTPIISTTGSKQSFSNGKGVSFKLSIYNDLESYLTFYVLGSGTVYSSYQHAKTTVTLNQSKNYTISASGYGGTTLFDSSVANKYDGMNGVNISV